MALERCRTRSSGANGTGDCEQAYQLLLAAIPENVCNGVSIQFRQKGFQRLIEDTFQCTGGNDRAGVRLLVKAFGEAKIRLGAPDHITQGNQVRRARKGHPPRTTGMDVHILVLGERVDYTNEMIF